MKLLKKILCLLNKETEPKYAIQMIVKGGVATYLPVIKEGNFGSDWMPIVKIYDKYVPLEFEKEGGLTQEECKQHIEAYKQQYAEKQKLAEFTVNYLQS